MTHLTVQSRRMPPTPNGPHSVIHVATGGRMPYLGTLILSAGMILEMLLMAKCQVMLMPLNSHDVV